MKIRERDRSLAAALGISKPPFGHHRRYLPEGSLRWRLLQDIPGDTVMFVELVVRLDYGIEYAMVEWKLLRKWNQYVESREVKRKAKKIEGGQKEAEKRWGGYGKECERRREYGQENIDR
ncbi:hypothetical protein W97_02888 [Coniosporium apollinis CBS 100218]|uniref:Uncharacterized protein n=1 Tax=Coniosporium apollinis (strain CBS 100218) TaxID=1168221 RepID=R7YP13_CONA1|nr:uncharacterized protein W97_02888 [Coniosporium apollinis CBS 100218]EON63660.1 hypothetical protein W97_02888 [Coniosporium apollinis CBS 100218]